MKIETFERLAYDIQNFNLREIKDLELMNDDELLEYQRELEEDSGNLSTWDHLRLLYTLKAVIIDLELIANERGINK